ncbi:MAG: hypothetical protein WAX77_04915 [Methylococcaceae bacterium]
MLNLPNSFAENEEVEVIVLSKKSHDEINYAFWDDTELKQIGKIGLHSESFVEDEEDYTTW